MKKTFSIFLLIVLVMVAILSAPQISVGATPVPLASDGFSQLTTTDGLGDSNYGGAGLTWTGSTWNVVAGGTVTNAPTTTGSDLIVNGNMETGNPPSSWTAVTSNLSSVADQRTGGTGTQSMEIAGTAGNIGKATEVVTTSVGTWYQIISYEKNGTSSASLNSTSGDFASKNISATWTIAPAIGRSTIASQTIQLYLNTPGVYTGRFDDVSMKALTLPSLLRSLNVYKSTVTANVNITLTKGSQAGLVLNLDSASYPNNFILAYHDGTNVRLVKAVAGVYTSLINTAATYVAGATLTISRSGNVYTVTYNGSQVGTATISDYEIVNNTLVGLFDSYGNTFDNFTVYDNSPAPTSTSTSTATSTATFTPTGTLDLTATTFTHATETAYALTATAGNWTPTFTMTPTKTLTPTSTLTATVMPTMYWDSRVTYGEFANTTASLCLGVLLLISFIAWLTISLLDKKS